ncbi:PadR family transcriptional regulator [Haloactinospora alba]|uniref:PadR family transcriptional regulator n=1 Tax=Haloactinospora alba TaxID=405555 RepID=A0A543NN62_9ACTN|nr:helix-turn-helix transcriptional regulator [Haloactinospora alba]TQN33269.1 PadR family transcriptional regulator [Haloactinospora alba]
MPENAGEGTRSPLNLVVLALLYEAPMHPYRMHTLIRERGKDRVVNVRSRNSVQQTVGRLEREGLIAASGTEQAGRYPQRTVYEITARGCSELLGSLHRLLSTPAREFPLFPAALSYMAIVTTSTAAELLRQRRAELAETVARTAETTRRAAEALPRIHLIEDEYAVAMGEAEIAWIDRTLGEIASGELDWDPERLIERARRDEH